MKRTLKSPMGYPKKDLPGYCATHGTDAANVFRVRPGKQTDTNALTASIILAVVKEFPGTVAWRSNVGRGVTPGVVQKALRLLRQGNVTEAIGLLNWPPSITFGVPGQADISGILAPGGRRLEIEVKAGKDRLSSQQKKFAAMIRAAGGVYVEARSVEDAIGEIREAATPAP